MNLPFLRYLPPTEEPVVTGELIPEIVPTEDPLLIPLVAPVAAPEESTDEEMETPAEVIQALPEEAALVVLDENGEPLPLVSVEAAEAIVTGDPMYCDGTDAPGSISCSSFTTIEQAVSYAQLAGNGECTIYVAQDYTNASTATINIDDSSFVDNNFNMFLVGGYDLTTGSLTYGTVVGQTTLNQNFYIDDITGSFTLANFFIKEFNSSGSTVYIEDSEDVTLDNMTINNKGNGHGVLVDDSHDITISGSTINEKADGYGIKMTDSYDILIVDTNVNEYGKDGGIYMSNVQEADLKTVNVDSNDDWCNGMGCSKDAVYFKDSTDVKLDEVNANSQFGSGLYSNNGWGYLSIIDSVFDNNTRGHGILVQSHDGVVYLEDVSASYNDAEGAEIQNEHTVTIKEGLFNHNDGEYGLDIDADIIEIADTFVDDNEHNGAILYADEWITILTSSFSSNEKGYGLNAYTDDQYIFIDGLNADGNETYGAHLDAQTDLTIKNATFDKNDEEGLWAESDTGAMLLEMVSASGNGYDMSMFPHGYGMHLFSMGDMTLTDVDAIGNFDYGLNAETKGALVISGSHFDENGWGNEGNPWASDGYGAHLISALDMTITDTTFNDNYNEGLYAEAGHGSAPVYAMEFIGGGWPPPPPPPVIGNILLDGVTASNNGYMGFGGAYAFGASLDTNGTLTILDSYFDHNRDYGVNGYAAGDIKVEGTSVDENQGWSPNDFGAKFHGESGIELIDSTFDNNWGPGLQVHVEDDISVNGISASNNKEWDSYPWFYPGYGAQFDTMFGGVNIADSYFDYNQGFGLFVWAQGDVVVNNTSASNNYFSDFWYSPDLEKVEVMGGGGYPPYYLGYFNGDGANIFSMNGFVEINTSHFDENDDDGLGVDAWEGIKLFKITASGNGDDGANLMSYGDTEVTCSTFKDNGSYGLTAGAFGVDSSVTLNGDTFSGNGSGDYSIWAGDLIENTAFPCGGGGGPTGGGPSGFIPPFIGGLIPVTGGEFVALSCDGISVIQLPSGEETIFNQPMCGYMAAMELVTEADLPGPLAGGWKFVDGFDVTLMFGDEVIVQLPMGGTDTLVFPLNEDLAKEEFHILFWDVSSSGGLGDWVDLGGVKEALKWVKTHNQTGTFLLVQ